MNDLKTIYNAIQSVDIPIEAPEALQENKELIEEYAASPYIDEKKNEMPLVKFKVKKSWISLGGDEDSNKAQIEWEFVPSNGAGIGEVTFEQEGEGIITVDENGLVTGPTGEEFESHAGETFTVTVKCGKFSANCFINLDQYF